MFADGDLARLREFPEISREELFRYFTLSPADAAFIDPGRGRGPADRLGIAIALCTLPWLGFGPDRVVTAPPVAVARLAEQLKVHPTESGDPARPGEHGRTHRPRPCAGPVRDLRPSGLRVHSGPLRRAGRAAGHRCVAGGHAAAVDLRRTR
nr:DUF4158 domain-containing protein [Nocardia nova]